MTRKRKIRGTPARSGWPYDRALMLQKDLVAKFGGQPEYVQDLAGSYNDRGILSQQTGEPEKAEED